MSASTEAIIIEIVFSLGALVAVGGLVALLVAKTKHRALRPAMGVIISGAGLVIIAALLNVLLFKAYDHVRVKKTQYYEITSLTANMNASLASSHARHQPVTPNAKKASKNVTYLIKHTEQSKAAVQLAREAQRELTHRQQPNVALVKHNYRLILDDYFQTIVRPDHVAAQLSNHAYQQATKFHK
ncbi:MULTISPECIES: hypothetical protein [Lactobacillaceae]|uniref:hypothetical protein n=1 Tax=Lactobacillaceae TaxID=33958 RepID=UPI001456342A|nr:hypothetical protein [Lactobacillus sp. HBUAS51381]NLR10267.1 hypothetical protein [Lactobacillus sp. HBUAS51381]